MDVASKELMLACRGSTDLLSVLSVRCCSSSCLPLLCDRGGCESNEQTRIHNSLLRWEILSPICRQGTEAQRFTAGMIVCVSEYKPGSAWPPSIKLDLHPEPFVDLGLSFHYGLFSLREYIAKTGHRQWACLGFGQVSFRHLESFGHLSGVMG